MQEREAEEHAGRLERAHVRQAEDDRAQVAEDLALAGRGPRDRRLGGGVGARVGGTVDELQEPAVRAPRVAGIALEHPAVRHHVTARPQPAGGVDHGRGRHHLHRRGRAQDRACLARLVHARAEQGALGVGAAHEHGRALGETGRGRGRRGHAARARARGGERRQDVRGDVERAQDLLGPGPPRHVVEHRLARVRVFGDALPGEQVGDPVVQHEERRHPARVAVLAEPEVAREREDVGRGVAGERMEPLRRDALEQLHALGGRARIQVRPRVEDLARAIDEHATLALAGGGHAQDARVGGEPRHHCSRAAREGTPERLGVEVEAAQEGEARVTEDGVAERLLGARHLPAGEVEGDRAPRSGACVERDEDVGHVVRPAARARPGSRPSAGARRAGGARWHPPRSRSGGGSRRPSRRRCAG